MEVRDYLSKLADKFKNPTPPKRGGINSEIAEQRLIISKLIEKDIKAVCGLTRGWTSHQLYVLMQDVEGTVAALREHGKKGNPAAIWWNRYRKKHILYGQKGQRAVRKVGPQRRTRKQEEGKGLFQ